MGFLTRCVVTLMGVATCANAFVYPYGKEMRSADVSLDNGAEVDISDYIARGDVVGAQAATRVTGIPNIDGLEMHSGFATTDADSGKKMFFWYFKAQNKNPDAPVVIWLQGGPGGSSLFGLFAEMGPLNLHKDAGTGRLEAELDPNSWNKEYDMLFIDNPVGAGFSYTSKDQYCPNTRDCVASNLYSLISQFYQVFPFKRADELYITGESYAGKYVPAFAAYIDNENKKTPYNLRIPLAGVAIGDGWTDPIHMVPGYPDMMFNQGLIDLKQKAVIADYCNRTEDFIVQGDMMNAFKVWDQMLNGDIWPYANLFHNMTGLNDYDNFYATNAPASLNYYADFCNRADIRRALHVGDRTLQSGHDCEMALLADFHVTYAPELVQLLESGANYKVVVYSGNLDVIIGTALTARFLEVLKWSGLSEYLDSDRKVWRITSDAPDVAGWVREAKNLKFIVVMSAGHLVPHDQPLSALNMIDHLIQNIPYTNEPNPVH